MVYCIVYTYTIMMMKYNESIISIIEFIQISFTNNKCKCHPTHLIIAAMVHLCKTRRRKYIDYIRPIIYGCIPMPGATHRNDKSNIYVRVYTTIFNILMHTNGRYIDTYIQESDTLSWIDLFIGVGRYILYIET